MQPTPGNPIPPENPEPKPPPPGPDVVPDIPDIKEPPPPDLPDERPHPNPDEKQNPPVKAAISMITIWHAISIGDVNARSLALDIVSRSAKAPSTIKSAKYSSYSQRLTANPPATLKLS